MRVRLVSYQLRQTRVKINRRINRMNRILSVAAEWAALENRELPSNAILQQHHWRYVLKEYIAYAGFINCSAMMPPSVGPGFISYRMTRWRR